MKFHQIIKDTIKNHKKKIELIQWAITSGVASLIYPEYISNIRQKQVPTRVILVPPIRRVQEFLNPDGEFIDLLSTLLIDKMKDDVRFKDYNNAPELLLFNDDNIETLKSIFDLYIVPNMYRSISETISKKFDLQNPQQQLIRESNEIDLFNRSPITNDQLNFIVRESVLQLLMLIPTMKKEIEMPENNINLQMSRKEILTIGHQSAICPIHIDMNIICIKKVIDLLKFVTNTSIEKVGSSENIGLKRDDEISYIINSDVFNQISFTRFIGIENSSNKKGE